MPTSTTGDEDTVDYPEEAADESDDADRARSPMPPTASDDDKP